MPTQRRCHVIRPLPSSGIWAGVQRLQNAAEGSKKPRGGPSRGGPTRYGHSMRLIRDYVSSLEWPPHPQPHTTGKSSIVRWALQQFWPKIAYGKAIAGTGGTINHPNGNPNRRHLVWFLLLSLLECQPLMIRRSESTSSILKFELDSNLFPMLGLSYHFVLILFFRTSSLHQCAI